MGYCSLWPKYVTPGRSASSRSDVQPVLLLRSDLIEHGSRDAGMQDHCISKFPLTLHNYLSSNESATLGGSNRDMQGSRANAINMYIGIHVQPSYPSSS